MNNVTLLHFIITRLGGSVSFIHAKYLVIFHKFCRLLHIFRILFWRFTDIPYLLFFRGIIEKDGLLRLPGYLVTFLNFQFGYNTD